MPTGIEKVFTDVEKIRKEVISKQKIKIT